MEEAGRCWVPSNLYTPDNMRLSLTRLFSCRLLGVTANEEFGGLGMGYQAHCVVMEELSRASGKNCERKT